MFSFFLFSGFISITKLSEESGIIDSYAFNGCQFKKVYIEDNILVKENAFYGNPIDEIFVGENCIVEKNAFENIPSLKRLILKDCFVDKKAFYRCYNIEALHIDGSDLDLQLGCFDYIQPCIYYHGVVDLFMDSTILVINRIYKAVFVNASYQHDTFCLIPVKKGLNQPCPAFKSSNSSLLNRDKTNNIVNVDCKEQTCDTSINNSKYAYLFSFLISFK